MQLNQEDCGDRAERHRRKQNVNFQVLGDQQAGRAPGQKPRPKDQERATRADATNKEPRSGANRGYQQESEPGLRSLQRRLAASNVYDKGRLQGIDQAGTPDGTRAHARQQGQAERDKQRFQGEGLQV